MREHEPRILIVDDQDANIFYLEGILGEEDYEVISCTGGAEALRILENQEPDVILLDLMMPGMSGLEVLQKIQVDPYLKKIPVIMVTAKVEPEDVEEAMSMGAIDYIKKPFIDVELLARVKSALRIKKNEDELRINVRSKEEFVRIVSHDLRGPFMNITGVANLLLQDQKLDKVYTDEHKELLNIIIDTANNLVSYFNKLLNWSKLESDKLEINKMEHSLLTIINTNKVVLDSKIKKKELVFDIDIPEGFVVKVDAVYFSQVINNLIGNAIKFTPEGGKIYIVAEEGGRVDRLRIIDEGIGIKEISAEELFNGESYYTTSGTNGEKGSGIGLRICKKILDAHGFSIDFISSDMGGTEFFIDMPKFEEQY